MQRRKLCVWAICMFLLLAAAAGCSGDPGQPEHSTGVEQGGSEGEEQNPLEEKVAPPPEPALKFAAYEEVPVNFTPAVQPYEVEPGLGNITRCLSSPRRRSGCWRKTALWWCRASTTGSFSCSMR